MVRLNEIADDLEQRYFNGFSHESKCFVIQERLRTLPSNIVRKFSEILSGNFWEMRFLFGNIISLTTACQSNVWSVLSSRLQRHACVVCIPDKCRRKYWMISNCFGSLEHGLRKFRRHVERDMVKTEKNRARRNESWFFYSHDGVDSTLLY